MPTLIERLTVQIDALTVEKQRIVSQGQADMAAVNEKLAALRQARSVITPEVEAAYNALKAMGIFKEF